MRHYNNQPTHHKDLPGQKKQLCHLGELLATSACNTIKVCGGSLLSCDAAAFIQGSPQKIRS